MHMQYKVDPADALALPSFRSLYLLTAAVALLVGADLACWWLGYETLRNPLGFNLSLIAAVLGGARIIYGAVASLLEGDVGADLALAIALLAALLLKEYWVGAEVVLIALVGESLEALTFARTHRELARILELRPRNVRVRRGGHELEIPVDEVVIGDTVIVRPGERIPVDGSVLAGRSTIDQSTLTGEGLPVDKGEGDSVFAGTLNQFGALEVRTQVVGEHTTLGQVIQLVAEAQQHKAGVERTADRLARYFLPFVLLCAAATFVVTNVSSLAALWFGGVETWVWMPTLAVLVVACPCALILATPAAMMAALAWLARRGVLIKGGAALEQLAAVTRIAFDKTGTLTTGELQLGDCLALGQHRPQDVLRLAATAEQPSEHLIARAIVRAARQQGLQPGEVHDFEALPGAGVSGSIETRTLLVGNRRLLQERGIEVSTAADQAIGQLEAAVQTPLLVCLDGQVIGLVGLRDATRPEAARVISELRSLGIDQIALLTGDRRAAAARVAAEVGIDLFEAELRPDEKARWLAAWRGEGPPGKFESAPHRVAMIGDGVNDAPALASADVGLALAGIGSDLAAEASDLVLMGDPLTPLPAVLRLARETVRVIRQNILLFAFGVNFLGIVLTAWIMPSWSEAWLRRSPVAAALFHQVGSVLVLLNAMRLLWFERWQASVFGRVENALAIGYDNLAQRFAPLASFGSETWRLRWRLAGAAAVVLIAAYLSMAIVIVQPDEVAVAQRFGRFEGTLLPGLHLRLPPPWDTVIKEKPERVRTIEIGLRSTTANRRTAALAAIEWNSPHQEGVFERRADEAIILTGDQSLVEVGATVQYRIGDLRAYRFGVREPDRVLQSLAEGVIREVLATEPLLAGPDAEPSAREILTTARSALEERIGVELQQRAESLQLGIEILSGGVCLQDVHPPLEVVGAFRDVSVAFKEKERMRNEADASYRDKVIKAGGKAAWGQLSGADAALTDEQWEQLQPQIAGEAAAELFSAQAFAAEQQELAAGHAASFVLQEAAHARSPQLTAWRLFLDSLASAMPGKKKLILDHAGAGRRHLFLGVPQNGTNAVQPLIGFPESPNPEAHE